jgi:hypothetical protein
MHMATCLTHLRLILSKRTAATNRRTYIVLVSAGGTSLALTCTLMGLKLPFLAEKAF